MKHVDIDHLPWVHVANIDGLIEFFGGETNDFRAEISREFVLYFNEIDKRSDFLLVEREDYLLFDPDGAVNALDKKNGPPVNVTRHGKEIKYEKETEIRIGNVLILI